MNHDLDPTSGPSSQTPQWSDTSSREALRLVAEAVAQMVGFELAVISRVHEGELVSVACEAPAEFRPVLMSVRTPLSAVLTEIELADDWGRFKFVPGERSELSSEDAWTPDSKPADGPDGWGPEDVLFAPLYSDDGEILGALSIDGPIDSRRPAATQRALLERYAAQAERALVNATERHELGERLRLAEAARQVVRVAVSQPDVDTALDQCGPALLRGFRADDLTIRTYGDELFIAQGTRPTTVTEELRSVLRHAARTCWDEQRVGVLYPGFHDTDLLTVQQYNDVSSFLSALGYASAMIVPLGAARSCLGHLILLRVESSVPWTPDERLGALEVARDIGQAILSARALAQEQTMVAELRELARYKTQLLSTVSHELKNPLGAIAGHLELVADDGELSQDTQLSVAAMDRATGRMTRVVDDLLALAKLEDPLEGEPSAPLDLRPSLIAAFDNSRFAAERRSVTLALEAPTGPLRVCADRDGLERVLTNLIGNAVKYTERDSSVVVRVVHHLAADADPKSAPEGRDEVEIAVIDRGIGISEADQAHLFTEFFRSTNPAALAEPGTGLGLAISDRIVARHGGRITVESSFGVGSTFRVFLPGPTNPVGLPRTEPRRPAT